MFLYGVASLVNFLLQTIPDEGSAAQYRSEQIVSFLNEVGSIVVVTIHDEHLAGHVVVQADILASLVECVALASMQSVRHVCMVVLADLYCCLINCLLCSL